MFLHCALSYAVYCNRPCLFVCFFVGARYYSQRAVFASPLSAFFILCMFFVSKISIANT